MIDFKERNEHFARAMTDAQVSYIEAERAACDLEADNAELREQMERLVTLLRNDCDIDASWDGLRKFWSIGLTEDGCLMRDRACKAEAENQKLRELVHWMYDRMDESCAVQHPYAPTPINYEQLLQAQARACELGVDSCMAVHTITQSST